MVKIAFEDFWGHFKPKQDPIFGKLLQDNYNIEYTNKTPDVVVFSVFGDRHKKYNKKDTTKIFYAAENFEKRKYPALDQQKGWDNVHKYSHYSITPYRNEEENHLRVPNYIRKHGYEIKNDIENVEVPEKKKDIVYMQSSCVKYRDDFVKNLRKKVSVDCVGKCIKNKNVNVKNKTEFIKNYKMNVSFENSVGYVSEKIVDAFIANTIPIYYGDPRVEEDYNKDAFINYHNFKNEEELIDHIISVLEDDQKIHDMIKQPRIVNHELFDKNNAIKFFDKIFKE